jgi:hypothetical protein
VAVSNSDFDDTADLLLRDAALAGDAAAGPLSASFVS